MRLLELAHVGFRNLADGRLKLSPGTTVLLGDNGQGKTSWLEAIGVLATTKSFRRAKPRELARHGRDDFAVAGSAESASGTVELSVSFEGKARRTRLGGTDVELTEYIENLVVVPVTQAHAGILRGGPEERRSFLDRGILGVRPSFLRTLAAHRQTLAHVSALLRSPSARERPAQLEAWSERRVRDGAEITLRRREYLASLQTMLEDAAPAFLPAPETLELALHDVVSRSPVLAEAASAGELRRADVEQALRERLATQQEREIAGAHALVGPQRDDLEIHLAGRDARRFASSGQQRAVLLALKLAKVEVFRVARGEPPVLLVDDVDTEVDARRLGAFLDHLQGRAQAVLTSSKRDLFQAPSGDALFYLVRDGLLTSL